AGRHLPRLARLPVVAQNQPVGTGSARDRALLHGGARRVAGEAVRTRRAAGSAWHPVPAVPAGVDLAGVPQVAAVEVGKERVEEDELRVGRLPDQEVGGPLLPR